MNSRASRRKASFKINLALAKPFPVAKPLPVPDINGAKSHVEQSDGIDEAKNHQARGEIHQRRRKDQDPLDDRQQPPEYQCGLALAAEDKEPAAAFLPDDGKPSKVPFRVGQDYLNASLDFDAMTRDDNVVGLAVSDSVMGVAVQSGQ